MKRILFLALLLLTGFVGLLSAQEQQTARIGDFKLQSGEIIRDCAMGYRTFGSLNPNKSNAVLFPTAFGWRSAGLATRIGPGKLVDSDHYYVIAVDSLGDGISSSPSNSKSQHGLTFPEFSIRDMVNIEQKVVSENLHIQHLHAVIGFSMGGMQAFQWAVSYPDFVDKIVSIVGSPQLTSYDLLLWRTLLLALESDPDWKQGQYTREPALHLMNMVQSLALQTPQFVATNTPRKDFSNFESELVAGPDDLDANDTLRQIQALLSTDVTASFGGSLQGAAAAVRAQSLVIVNRQDHLVNPLPASQFANLLHAKLIELDSNCGHRVHSCEIQRISQQVAAFLAN
ncbi:MAG: alpha/beta fold hydrolase [Candidatus Acidiferrales bacterium]